MGHQIDMNVSRIIFSLLRITPLGTPVTMDDFLEQSQVAAGYRFMEHLLIVVHNRMANGFTLNPANFTCHIQYEVLKEHLFN
jgi:fructose-1,6-bisphosphatase I